jgi:hypothetical protein
VAYAEELASDPADEVFMRGVEVADTLDRRRIARHSDSDVEVKESVLRPGLRGRLLRQRKLLVHSRMTWDLGKIEPSNPKRLLLGRDGTIYYSRTGEKLWKDGDRPLFLDVIELEHGHLHGEVSAERALHMLDRL